MAAFFDQDVLTVLTNAWPVSLDSVSLFDRSFAGRVTQADLDTWRAVMRPNGDPNWLIFGTGYRKDLADRAQVIAVHQGDAPDQAAMGGFFLGESQRTALTAETVTMFLTSPNWALVRPMSTIVYAILAAAVPTFREIGYERIEYQGTTALVQEAAWLPENVLAMSQTWRAVSLAVAPTTADNTQHPIVVNRTTLITP